MQSADRRRLRVYARVLRLPVLLVDAAAARRRGGRVPAADARRRGRGRRRPEGHLERHRSERDYSYGHPQGAPGVAARQGREDRGARGDPLPSRRRDTGAAQPPRQVPQRVTLQVTPDADQAAAQEAEGPRYLRGTATPGVRVADGCRQERQVGVSTRPLLVTPTRLVSTFTATRWPHVFLHLHLCKCLLSIKRT